MSKFWEQHELVKIELMRVLNRGGKGHKKKKK